MAARIPKDYLYVDGTKITTVMDTTQNVEILEVQVDGDIEYLKGYSIDFNVYSPQNRKPSWAVNPASSTLQVQWNSVGGYWRCTSYSTILYLHPNAGTTNQEAITRIHFVRLAGLAQMKDICMNFHNLTSVTFAESNLTKHMDSFNRMFMDCWNLVSVELFDTSSGNDFFEMYRNCRSVLHLPLVISPRPADFQGMYSGCAKLVCITGVDTSHTVGTMSKRRMFAGCVAMSAPTHNTQQSALVSSAGFNFFYTATCPNINLNFKMLVTSKAKPQLNMNSATPLYQELKPGLWNVTASNASNVIHVSFKDHTDNESVTEIQIERGRQLTFFGSSFRKCPNLVKVTFDNGVTNNVDNMADLFNDCRNLEKVVGLNLSSATNMNNAFLNCEKLVHLGRDAVAPKVTTAVSAFENCKLITGATLQCPVLENASRMYKASGIVSINNQPYPKLNTAPAMFQACLDLKTVPALNLPELGACNSMFRGCSSLTNVSNMVLPKAHTVGGMFAQCTELVNVSAIILDKATSATEMFKDDAKLVSSLVTGFGKCTDISGLYFGCSSLVTMANIDYGEVLYMNDTFRNCSSMTHYKAINSAKCVNMLNLFRGGSALVCLESIDTTSNNQSPFLPFVGCGNLVAPNTADIALIDQAPGIAWTNPGTCP